MNGIMMSVLYYKMYIYIYYYKMYIYIHVNDSTVVKYNIYIYRERESVFMIALMVHQWGLNGIYVLDDDQGLR